MSSLEAKENDICGSLRFFSNCQMELGSQTLCKLLDADHDDTRKYFFDGGQKTEISISATGYFGEMKKTETPSKRRRVGRWVIFWTSVCHEPTSNYVFLTCLTCSVYHRRVQPQVHQPPRVGHAPDVSPRPETEENTEIMYTS